MKPLLLIIDTAHPTARVILANDEKILGVREWENTPKLGTDLLIHIDELLQECECGKSNITRIAVHPGPGSYGLVRTGIVTATIFVQSVGAELVAVQGETMEELVESARTAKPIASLEQKYNA